MIHFASSFNETINNWTRLPDVPVVCNFFYSNYNIGMNGEVRSFLYFQAYKCVFKFTLTHQCVSFPDKESGILLHYCV